MLFSFLIETLILLNQKNLKSLQKSIQGNGKVQKKLKYKTKYDNIQAICSSYDWYIKNLNSNYSSKNKSHHKTFTKQRILSLIKYII